MIKFEFTYYVAYMHSKGYGCISVQLNRPISYQPDYPKQIAALIQEANSSENVCIINWKFLKFRARLGK